MVPTQIWPPPINCKNATNPIDVRVLSDAKEHFNPDAPFPDPNTVGNNPTLEGFNDVIKKQINPRTDCISRLLIMAHGWLGGDVFIDNDFDDATDRCKLSDGKISEQNADFWFRQVMKKYCFCKPCKIYLNTCFSGRDGELSDIIHKATGCTVYAPKGKIKGPFDLDNPHGADVDGGVRETPAPQN